jgi:tripartite-type tricarboxylate transporter receptor subunit TctC
MLIGFLLAGATIPILAAEQRSANIDERAVADFYRGKIVRIVVGFPPGGGADVYSRVLVRHLGRFIPGNPTLAVTNMPGAGSIIAVMSSTRGPRTAPRSACSTAQLFSNSYSATRAFNSIWPDFVIWRCR